MCNEFHAIFFNSRIRGQSFKQFKMLATNSPLTEELKEVTTDSPIQSRTSHTDHVSAKLCKFVAIRGSRGRNVIRP